MKVYLIEQGEYEDREPVHIFTTRELAEDYVAKYCDSTASIYEYELWDRPIPRATVYTRAALVTTTEVLEQRMSEYEDNLHEADVRAVAYPRRGGIYVHSSGTDKATVDADYERLTEQARRELSK